MSRTSDFSFFFNPNAFLSSTPHPPHHQNRCVRTAESKLQIAHLAHCTQRMKWTHNGVTVRVCIFNLQNHWTSFDEIHYGSYSNIQKRLFHSGQYRQKQLLIFC
jgi:hypothetical protein